MSKGPFEATAAIDSTALLALISDLITKAKKVHGDEAGGRNSQFIDLLKAWHATTVRLMDTENELTGERALRLEIALTRDRLVIEKENLQAELRGAEKRTEDLANGMSANATAFTSAEMEVREMYAEKEVILSQLSVARNRNEELARQLDEARKEGRNAAREAHEIEGQLNEMTARAQEAEAERDEAQKRVHELEAELDEHNRDEAEMRPHHETIERQLAEAQANLREMTTQRNDALNAVTKMESVLRVDGSKWMHAALDVGRYPCGTDVGTPEKWKEAQHLAYMGLIKLAEDLQNELTIATANCAREMELRQDLQARYDKLEAFAAMRDAGHDDLRTELNSLRGKPTDRQKIIDELERLYRKSILVMLHPSYQKLVSFIREL